MGLSAAGALALAMLPAGVAAQDADARTTNPPCDGDADQDFDDIAGSAHEEQVRCMADEGLTEGTQASGGDSYAPRREVTRGQMAAFITRFVERHADRQLPDGDPDRFDDLGAGYVHAQSIDKLAEIGVVEGTNRSDGQDFAPQAGVTRAQMASMIRRALSYVDDGQVSPLSQPPSSGTDHFPDDAGSVHEDNIDALAGVGIVQGFEDGDYRPSANVLRDQMASFVMRSANYAMVEDLGADRGVASFDDVGLSWFDEVSTDEGEAFSEDDVFAVGDPGEDAGNGAEGSIDLALDPLFNTVSFDVAYGEVAGPFAEGPGLHIHVGDRDENGPIEVLLADGDELDDGGGELAGTVRIDRDEIDLLDIVDDPDAFYINLHSDDFPEGAIRGQLPDGPPSIPDGQETSTWQLTATADEVVDEDGEPGGEPGAKAIFDLRFDSDNDVVCYDIDTEGLAPGGYESPAQTATHIHEGEVGEQGPPRVLFRNPEGEVDADGDQISGERSSSGCHRVPQQTGAMDDDDVDEGIGFDLAAVEQDPEQYYVDFHTDAAPEGAVRAQFERDVETLDGIGLSWFDEVSTPEGEAFDADDVFAVGDARDTGENGAEGAADLTVDASTNSVSFEVAYGDVEPPFGEGPGLHIHEGDRDVNGPIVALLATGEELDAAAEDGVISGTVQVDRADLDVRDLIDAPESFYLNLHSDAFPEGAIRGQLDGPPTIDEEDATSAWVVDGDPDQVAGDDGEPGAEATFEMVLDSNADIVCYQVESDGVSGAYTSPAKTATHIHEGEAGEVGPPRVLLRDPVAIDPGDPDGERISAGCHRVPQETGVGDDDGVDEGVGFDLAAIEEDPERFYVDTHTEGHPDGAVRGQLTEQADVGLIPGLLDDILGLLPVSDTGM